MRLVPFTVVVKPFKLIYRSQFTTKGSQTPPDRAAKVWSSFQNFMATLTSLRGCKLLRRWPSVKKSHKISWLAFKLNGPTYDCDGPESGGVNQNWGRCKYGGQWNMKSGSGKVWPNAASADKFRKQWNFHFDAIKRYLYHRNINDTLHCLG